MAALKRNIWTLYFLIVIVGVALLGVSLQQRWQETLSDETAHQLSRAELVSQSVHSLFRTQELVLDVVGRELLDSGEPLEERREMPLLDSILSVNPALVSFGLARPDGTLVRISTNMDASRLPNLLENPSTAEGFRQALESDVMVVGRTYYVDALGAWLIPIRKALRADDGSVVAVMTAGLQIGAEGSVLGQDLHDGPEDSVILFREADKYVQFMSREGATPERYSALQINEERLSAQRRDFEERTGKTMADIMASPEAVSFHMTRDQRDYLIAATFDARYQIWTVSETRFAPLYRDFMGTLVTYVIGFVLGAWLLYLLFRVIDRAEGERREELLYRARHDDLTGLLNRAGLLDRLEGRLSQARPFSLVVINIDNFSGINDRFGLEYGDHTLVEFGRRLERLAERHDDLARLGSDEFAIVTPNTNIPSLTDACRALVEDLAQIFEVGGLRLQVGASVGVARYPEDGDSLSKLIRSAHLALYEAKQSRNAVCVYKAEMETAYLRRLNVEQRLRYGLASHALYMVYQPQVNDAGETIGLEALVRWQDEELGFVSPAEFVDVAEKSGLMIPLGNFVLDTSLREFRQLIDKVQQPLDLAINISVIQFCQPGFVDTVLNALKTHDVSPSSLVLEITETLFMGNFGQVLQTICDLRSHGIRLAMDDFGTGYSSLSLLRQLPLDELKIDKSFVDGIVEDEKAANMVRSIVAIARSHNMSLIAEGVEEQAQAQALIKMGCLRFQGYCFSRPVAMADIRQMLTDTANTDNTPATIRRS
ncbi:putative bifunctional diguanylate cyclase/phosphodiesterase [Marinobacter nauticus]|uniref:putative bifunctional diguanylate cyclase/phosphodiesterase n=1 Tax=Marinobacter nauticus TaxID=2743 RepID=UPI001CD2583E|nr:EAL domain-containing protein [Marinobacter nauticus]MCA0914488.1 EAL domain-containing protein [Marinobacter nauticus]